MNPPHGVVIPRAAGQAILMDNAMQVPIPNEQSTFIAQPLQVARLEEQIQPPRRLRASSHPGYNCHGLTFGARRAELLDEAAVSQLLHDDGYQPVEPREALPGDCIVYFNADGEIEHSAIVVSDPEPPLFVPTVVSKWGAGPEVIHAARDCPYAVGDLRYYRIRP